MPMLLKAGCGVIVPPGLLAERALWKRPGLIAVKRKGYERQYRVHAFLPCGYLVWSGAFETLYEQSLFIDGIGRGIHPFELPTPTPAWNPSLLDIPGLLYCAPTIETFDSTPGGGTWTCPSGVTQTDVLVVAGGASGGAGSGGFGGGGGGGAGEYIYATARAVIPATVYPLTVGPGGATVTGPGGTSNGTVGNDGTDSVFDTLTAKKGGGGGAGSSVDTTSGKRGRPGGSGGGGGANTGTFGTASPNTGLGNNGAASVDADSGGGGGSAAAGSGQTGGAGTSNSITGSAVTYAKGGNGKVNVSGTVTGAAGVNPGDGGDGGGNTGSGGDGGEGRIGRVVLSYTPSKAFSIRQRPTRFFRRRF